MYFPPVVAIAVLIVPILIRLLVLTPSSLVLLLLYTCVASMIDRVEYFVCVCVCVCEYSVPLVSLAFDLSLVTLHQQRC